MKEKSIIIILVIISSVINIFLFVKLHKTNKSLSIAISNEHVVKTKLIQNIDYQESQINYSGKRFVGKNTILDTIKKLTENSPKIFMSFNEYACESCLNMAFSLLDSIGNEIGYERIIVLTNFDNNNYAISLSKKYQDKFNVLNIDTINFGFLENKEFLTKDINYFIMDDKMLSYFFFYYSLNFPSLNKSYHDAIIKYFNHYENL